MAKQVDVLETRGVEGGDENVGVQADGRNLLRRRRAATPGGR